MTIIDHSSSFFQEHANTLLAVENPGRYVGGEWGEIVKSDASLRFCIAFPDLYEIGMSNQAMKIIYNRLNSLPDVYCERVFCPAVDFEEYLAKNSLDLYTLETKTAICEMDIIGFSFGYELGFSGVLTILNSSKIPLYSTQRSDKDPIIFMGGPACSNPLPYSQFIDCFWIGEAEDRFFDLSNTLSKMKKDGANRKDLLELIAKEESVWMPGKSAKRNIDNQFSKREASASVLPVSNIKIIQDHGAVEIMRGCPNACRFCHAGVWYKPMRQKEIPVIKEEVKQFVNQAGYREITLSSLSSGDYRYIESLVSSLTSDYAKRKISFQLPSLKVSSFTLSIMEQLSRVRKSGLTFAIETPWEMAQYSINKEVKQEQVISIIREAKAKGWRQAKFYFMIGLPVNLPDGRTEETEIVEYIKAVYRATKFSLNVNVGTFVPKPHTPFQWASQIDEQEAWRKMLFIRNELKGLGVKVSTHNTFVSMLEGVLSRGDERVGGLLLEAWKSGSRLDAWEDHINKDVWKKIIEENQVLCNEILGPRNTELPLPWNSVESSVSSKWLLSEYRKSQSSLLSEICKYPCTHNCGICEPVGTNNIAENKTHIPLVEAVDEAPVDPSRSGIQAPISYRILFKFSKEGALVFTPHLGMVELFSKAFVRSNLCVFYTEGFNPLPKIEFASPLAMGIFAKSEVAQIEMSEETDPKIFMSTLNKVLPPGVQIQDAMAYRIPLGTKKLSASACLHSFVYCDDTGERRTVAFREDKAYRLEHTGKILVRESVLARTAGEEGPGMDYFDFFKGIYCQDD